MAEPFLAQILLAVDGGIAFAENPGESLIDKLINALVTVEGFFEVDDETGAAGQFLAERKGRRLSVYIVDAAAQLQLFALFQGLAGGCIVAGRVMLVPPGFQDADGIPQQLRQKRPALPVKIIQKPLIVVKIVSGLNPAYMC